MLPLSLLLSCFDLCAFYSLFFYFIQGAKTIPAGYGDETMTKLTSVPWDDVDDPFCVQKPNSFWCSYAEPATVVCSL